MRILLLIFLYVQTIHTNDLLWDEECMNDGPLGMISGSIQDWQITASSESSDNRKKHCEEYNARIYQKNRHSWCAREKTSSEWLQVDLGVPARVTGVMTQGRGDGREWVDQFMLSYSLNGLQFTYVKDEYGKQKIFEGNSDSYTVKHNYLDETIKARFIKFHVYTWQNHPSMRVEILGCQSCMHILGMPPYTRLEASSEKGSTKMRSCTAEYGHIFSNKAWCALKHDARQYLQLDIGPPTLITGLITKGREDSKKQFWVTHYQISYSNDSYQFFYYKDSYYMDPKYPQWNYNAQSNMAKVFEGNMDKNTEKRHYLTNPFVARYIRFHPVAWHDKIGLRAGLVGCQHKGDCGTGYFRINNQSSCVANLAYRKSAWIKTNGRVNRHSKRHLGGQARAKGSSNINGDNPETASLAVDGGLQRCTVMEYSYPYTGFPTWFVDLKEISTVSGVVIYISQDVDTAKKTHLDPRTLANLERLTVYITNKRQFPNHGKEEPPQSCGYMTRLNQRRHSTINHNNKTRLHIPCKQPTRGHYVFVEAQGVANSWMKEFAAVLCEVMVY